MQFIDLSAQLASMRTAIDRRINAVLDHGQFIMGPEVAELESQLAEYVGVKHCISCANGTDALEIALMSHNIGPGDVVITTAFSFFSTAEVIALVGATPYFVDIDPITFNLCPNQLELALRTIANENLGHPKAVIAVDLFGLPANYIELEALCLSNDLVLIEDAAQGFGGAINGQKAGSFGDISTTSFFPAKPLGCFGDGGAVFTDNDHVADKARSIRVHGKGKHKYENVRIGLNSRLDTIQAAILLEKLQHFEQELIHRQAIKEVYQQLSGSWVKPLIPEGYYSSWAQYTLVLEHNSREKVQAYLKQHDIPSMVYYPIPLNEQPAFTSYRKQSTPIAKKMSQRVLSLPMSGYLPIDDAQRVVEVLNKI